jgi:hypothetical protein
MKTVNEHCVHCPGPDDLAHMDPAYVKAEADCAFYENPEHRQAAGPAHRPKRSAQLTSHAMVRFPAGVLDQVQELAAADGRTVSGWIRHVVNKAIEAAR